jgi:hypothetical protein
VNPDDLTDLTETIENHWITDPAELAEILIDFGTALAVIKHMLPTCDFVLHPAINTNAHHLLNKYPQ